MLFVTSPTSESCLNSRRKLGVSAWFAFRDSLSRHICRSLSFRANADVVLFDLDLFTYVHMQWSVYLHYSQATIETVAFLRRRSKLFRSDKELSILFFYKGNNLAITSQTKEAAVVSHKQNILRAVEDPLHRRSQRLSPIYPMS
jgi:hypothetical protein